MKEEKYDLVDGLQNPSVLENKIENIQERAEDILENGNPIEFMMKYRVKQHKVKGLYVLINIVDSLYSSEEVETIQKDLLKWLKKPKDHTVLSKDQRDNIFKGPSGDWANEEDGGGYGAIKPIFKVIKKLMFEDDSKDKRVADGDEW